MKLCGFGEKKDFRLMCNRNFVEIKMYLVLSGEEPSYFRAQLVFASALRWRGKAANARRTIIRTSRRKAEGLRGE